MRDYLRTRLPPAIVPARVHIVDTLPRLPNGKLDRLRLLEAAAVDSTEARPAARAPGTPIEMAVARTWADVFGGEDVALDDDFFELGGDSIVALQLASRLRTALTAEVTVREVFEHRTVAALAAVISAKQDAPPAGGPSGAGGTERTTWSSRDSAAASTAPMRTGSA